jgi:hypothetical protein
MMGKPLVIVIEERHPWVSGGLQARVARGGVATQVPIVPDELGAEGLGDLRGVIGRMVVDHDHLGGAMGVLRFHASNRALEETRPVVGRDDDRDGQRGLGVTFHSQYLTLQEL